jgi:tetratricopeptide (TPR) repeat protein
MQDSKYWKVRKRDGSKLEPASLEVLRHWVETGQVGPDDRVIHENLTGWILASEASELSDLFPEEALGSDPKSSPQESSTEELFFEAEIAPGADKDKDEEDVRVPDCAFHPGTTAEEICIGCGKFICEECRNRVERKIYCKKCLAEKQAGVEPGAPVGIAVTPDPEQPEAGSGSRLAIAGVAFSAVAFVAAVMIVFPSPNILIAPAAGFFAFMGALFGGRALAKIRQIDGPERDRRLALAGVISGGIILAATVVMVTTLTMGGKARLDGTGERPRPTVSRGPGTKAAPSARGVMGREEAASKMLNRAGSLLGEGMLAESIERCEEILRQYPDTESAKLVKERLPLLIEKLEKQRAEDEDARSRDEESARRNFDHAMKMFSDGAAASAMELLEGLIESYPGTEAAEKALARIALEEKEAERLLSEKNEKEAGDLIARADRLLEEDQYEEAAGLYGKIVEDYSGASVIDDARLGLERAEKLASDPSEREFHMLSKELRFLTYEESIARLRSFIEKNPRTERGDEAGALLKENTRDKRNADNLYNFGKAHFEEGKYQIALGRFTTLVEDYPRSRLFDVAREKREEILAILER